MPTINFAQAPNFGTAADFVLFSTDGAVSNTGISHFTGNIGTNNGSSTAFGNVDGIMHDADDASAQCAEDLLFAYQEITGTTANFAIASLIGNGDTLLAGVYSISEASTLSNNLYLDAQGNSDAVFIFHVTGAFSSVINSQMILTNGAQAKNVFWKVVGAVDLAANTSFAGTIVSKDGAISIGNGSTIEGRALTTNGAVSTDAATVTMTPGCSDLTSGVSEKTVVRNLVSTFYSNSGNTSLIVTLNDVSVINPIGIKLYNTILSITH